MGAAFIRALILTAALAAAPVGALAAAPGDSAPAVESGEASPGAETGPESADPTFQTLSTLGALALGVLGLLWVRRHTSDL